MKSSPQPSTMKKQDMPPCSPASNAVQPHLNAKNHPLSAFDPLLANEADGAPPSSLLLPSIDGANHHHRDHKNLDALSLQLPHERKPLSVNSATNNSGGMEHHGRNNNKTKKSWLAKKKNAKNNHRKTQSLNENVWGDVFRTMSTTTTDANSHPALVPNLTDKSNRSSDHHQPVVQTAADESSTNVNKTVPASSTTAASHSPKFPWTKKQRGHRKSHSLTSTELSQAYSAPAYSNATCTADSFVATIATDDTNHPLKQNKASAAAVTDDAVATAAPSSGKFPWQKKSARRHRKTQSLAAMPLTALKEDIYCSFSKLGLADEVPPATPTGAHTGSRARASTGESPFGQPRSGRGSNHQWSEPLTPPTTSNEACRGRARASTGDPLTLPSGKVVGASGEVTSKATSSPITSPMILDLWNIQKEQQQTAGGQEVSNHHLAAPALAKPRPTSFLTGKELNLAGQEEATNWQLEIPSQSEFEGVCKLAQFLETYQSKELIDLSLLVGCSKVDLSMFAAGNTTPSMNKLDCHYRPIVESLLGCSSDLYAVRGHMWSRADGPLEDRRQVLVLERQKEFLCIFAGTVAEQQHRNTRQQQQQQDHTITLNGSNESNGVTVFKDYFEALSDFEQTLFSLLDRLTDESPFCDVVFGGHGFGAAMAQLAAYRYGTAHPELRCAALVSAAPRVGLENFRCTVNSLTNVKMMRLELGRATHAPSSHGGGCSAGHLVRIHSGKSSSHHLVRAFKFSDGPQEGSGVRSLLSLKHHRDHKDISEYVQAMHDLATHGHPWVKDYFREDGAGVQGKDNEARQMV